MHRLTAYGPDVINRLRGAARKAAIEWNGLIESAERRAGGPIMWERQWSDWGIIVVNGAEVYGRDEVEALRRFLAP